MFGDFPALAGVQCGVPQLQDELDQLGKEWQGRVFPAGKPVKMRRMRVAQLTDPAAGTGFWHSNTAVIQEPLLLLSTAASQAAKWSLHARFPGVCK